MDPEPVWVSRKGKNVTCAYGDSNPEPSSPWLSLYIYQGYAHKAVINNSSVTVKINTNSLQTLTKLQSAWQQLAAAFPLQLTVRICRCSRRNCIFRHHQGGRCPQGLCACSAMNRTEYISLCPITLYETALQSKSWQWKRFQCWWGVK